MPMTEPVTTQSMLREAAIGDNQGIGVAMPMAKPMPMQGEVEASMALEAFADGRGAEVPVTMTKPKTMHDEVPHQKEPMTLEASTGVATKRESMMLEAFAKYAHKSSGLLCSALLKHAFHASGVRLSRQAARKLVDEHEGGMLSLEQFQKLLKVHINST